MMSETTIDFISLGCSKNLVDSEMLMGLFEAHGYSVTHDAEDPQGRIVVVNTCGFIADAKEESINCILEQTERKRLGEVDRVYVMGCLSERYLAELEEEIADVTAATTINQKQTLAQRFAETFRAIYDCKKAYVNYMNYVEVLFNTAWAQAASDPQLAEGTMLVELQDFMDNVFAPRWENGAYTQQEAEEMNDLKSLALYEYFYSIPLDIVDGKYQITSADDLKALARIVNFGSSAVNAVLTADITIGSDQAMIGTIDNPYRGNFDGQGHTIKNFNITASQHYSGLFGVLSNGAVIENFSISGSLTSTHKENGAIGYADGASVVSGVHSSLDITVNCRTHSGGVVGASASDTSTLRVDGCSYSGTLTIEGTDADVTGGIIGYTYYGTIQNCIFSGTINGNADDKPYGGILGYAKIETFGGIHNCLVLGKIVTNASNTTASILIGKWNGPATSNVGNNYYLPNAGSSSNVVLVGGNTDNVTAPILVTTEQLASGEITAKLGYAFHQNLGIDATPTLDKTKGYVTQIGTAGYSTQYITDSDVTIPSNIEAFAGVINGSNITLESITDKIAAGEPVVLRGTEGIYNFMPTTGATEATENNLKGSDGTVTGGDNIYALAKKGNPAEVGFYPVSSSVKIPAGRVYLEYTAPTPVKGFYGFEEDDATGISLMEDGRSKMEDGAIYNVAGQRISKMQKGINIVNGKKIAVK